MPYVGLSPFLRKTSGPDPHITAVCQCPMSGYPHFYGYERVAPAEKRMCQCPMSGYPHFYGSLSRWRDCRINVSMPYVGLSPFLLWVREKSGRLKKCVNALCRAIPISTVTSRNPHKQGAQFRNNSCNCQTIHFYPYFYSIFSFIWYISSFSGNGSSHDFFIIHVF